ncbi:MAG: divergent PAP2 family protein [Patescibacteria group bacterium]
MLSVLREIFYNEPLISAFTGWLGAQGVKVITKIVSERRFDFKWFVLTGGIISSHTAGVIALATSCAIKFGLGSGYFALASALAALIIFDARIIRKAAGKQAEALNKIVEDLYRKKKLEMIGLRELLGHTSVEVFIGAIFGLLIGVLLTY